MSIPFAVLFDMDGTLLQTERLSTPAFQKTFEELREKGLWNGATPDEQELTNVLGMTIEQLWEKLLPGASEEIKKVADKLMLKNELILLKQGIADLYPGVREVLQELHANGTALFVASNGLERYIDEICEHFGIKPLFTDLYSAGRFGTRSKKDLVAKLLQDYQVKQAVMVGDRHSDVEAGLANGLKTIGCDFGFAKPGELDGADVIITRFTDLLTHIPDRQHT
ncbi:HAD family hydrolase [Brevibacillus borstelensis]|jgi:phosphoglycolate phosphatase|uniref:HAD family hydrolase n=1 Tax=Brevibacillus borstelensis TaxID=45462 RepID=UPI0004F26D88|nr:HAD-IA family hydrolase [Brevibacillus borstelensis]KKX54629.1 haloacid dehalogenase [Brevibacillus borstelensis cifa_chp40]MED1854938.1 HAD-IA family hydrolase [Brevibacillus borstelensis]MED1883379.1 HAD-IA family hydrolase [Brevibacillus borstelensis]RNB63259.1 HAD family hydrolase [Brevibacillus borstelensis]GED54559.1 MTA/SAH nucleosidase [Brevibacillus borstelensis]